MADTETMSFQYEGTELDLFRRAVNWKQYWSSKVLPYLSGDVLEVGAGSGTNTPYFEKAKVNSWTALEPDEGLARQIQFPATLKGRSVVGTIASLPADNKFDSILYIDVLEHIEDDAAELVRAAARLRVGGALVVLSPAHSFLFTPFDAAIGHFRRYSRDTLKQAAPTELRTEKLVYLDSIGMAASLANRLVLSQSMPTEGQILLWDSLMVPISRIADPLTFGKVGKTVLGIWRKPDR
jgi:SAM-dependent methyltransferase